MLPDLALKRRFGAFSRSSARTKNGFAQGADLQNLALSENSKKTPFFTVFLQKLTFFADKMRKNSKFSQNSDQISLFPRTLFSSKRQAESYFSAVLRFETLSKAVSHPKVVFSTTFGPILPIWRLVFAQSALFGALKKSRAKSATFVATKGSRKCSDT